MQLSAYEDIYNYVERGFYPGSFENLGKKLLKDKREILERNINRFKLKMAFSTIFRRSHNLIVSEKFQGRWTKE